MVQVLPYVPSFVEQLGPTANNAFTSVLDSLGRRKQAKNDRAIYQQLLNPQLKAVDRAALLSQISPEKAKVAATLYAPLLKEQERSDQRRGNVQSFLDLVDTGEENFSIGNEFKRGAFPQQEGDSENIKPSVSGNAPDGLSPGEEIAALPGLDGTGEPTQSPPGSRQRKLNPKQLSDDTLRTLRSFAGQGGLEGQLGKLADAEFERREGEKNREAKLQAADIAAQREIAKEQRAEARHIKEVGLASEVARSNKILEGVEQTRSTLPTRERAIEDIKTALNRGDLGPGDFLAELNPIFEPLRGSSGALFKKGVKEFLIGNIGRVSGRPNQFLEQQIESSLPRLGRSQEANETVAAALQSEVDYDRQKVSVIDDLAQKDLEQYGYVKGNIASRADALLKPWAERRQQKLAYDVQEIYEREQGPEKLKDIRKVSSGTPLTLQKARALLELPAVGGDIDKAEKLARGLGYDIPDPAIYSSEQGR